jgi:peroxiredoxin
MKKIFFSIFTALIFTSQVFAQVTSNEPAPDFKLTDTKGQEHSLSDYKGKFVVLEWVNYDCPFVKKHYDSQNMQELQAQYTAQDVVWLSVNSSAEGKQGNFSPTEIDAKIAQLKAQPSAYLLDTDGAVGKLYGAQTTPHMFVIDPNGTLVYQGAIDDNDSFDASVIADSKNYVVAALDSAMAGNPVEVSSTKSYGCSVKY